MRPEVLDDPFVETAPVSRTTLVAHGYRNDDLALEIPTRV